jgi:hypothetical protein
LTFRAPPGMAFAEPETPLAAMIVPLGRGEVIREKSRVLRPPGGVLRIINDLHEDSTT